MTYKQGKGSVLVVVVDVVEDEAVELLAVPDDGSVEEFAADGSDRGFGECVCHGRADGGLEDLEAFGAEDLVECFDELAAAISNQRSRCRELVWVLEEEVAGGLGGPSSGGVGRHAGGEHLSGGVGVGPERPVCLSADGFLRPALRTGRATSGVMSNST